MKKVVNIAIIIVIVCNIFTTISFAEIDFSGGLLDRKSFIMYGTTKITSITDNNTSTYYYFHSTTGPVYTFERPANIIGYRFLGNSRVRIDFFVGENLQLVRVVPSDITGQFVDYKIDDVRKISFYNTGAPTVDAIIDEFNVYGTLVKPKPSQVQNVSVTDITYNSVSISWDPVTEEVLKYKVYLNGQLYGETTATTYRIDDLQPATQYEVTVSAVNEAGEGLASDPVTFNTLDLPIPSKVMNVTVKDITSTSALIGWDPNPESEGVLKYIVYLNGQQYGETTNTEYLIDNLQPVTSYEVTIVAVNSYGEGSTADTLTFTTLEPPPKPASPVKNVVIKNMTSTSATISWTPNPASERIIKYVVYVNGEKYGETESTEYVLEDLKEGEKYTVTVAAVNALGEGPTSVPIKFAPYKIADISSTIKIQDIWSSIAVLFTNLWPLIAFILAVIAIVPITTALKQTITRRRSNA